MTESDFDRDAMARVHAARQLKTDPGTRSVYYLPTGAPAREIRLLEVNDQIVEMLDEALGPLDFGVDVGNPDGHTLLVMDVTPGQWERIVRREIALPPDWELEGAVQLTR